MLREAVLVSRGCKTKKPTVQPNKDYLGTVIKLALEDTKNGSDLQRPGWPEKT